MKKILTLCLALFCATATFAQSDDINVKELFVFADKDGNEIADGSVITCDDAEEDDFGNVQVNSGLFVKPSIEDDEYHVGLRVNIQNIDNGTLQFCFPMNCIAQSGVGTWETATSAVSPTEDCNDKGVKSLATEWLPDGYGQLTAKFTFFVESVTGTVLKPVVKKLGDGPSVTVIFINRDPTGINEVNANANATVVARYTADGKRVSAPVKGINILKLSNGNTVKVVR